MHFPITKRSEFFITKLNAVKSIYTHLNNIDDPLIYNFTFILGIVRFDGVLSQIPHYIGANILLSNIKISLREIITVNKPEQNIAFTSMITWHKTTN